MDNYLEWLRKTDIQYCPEITSYNKALSPVVIPAKRFLRKLFAFIGKPLVRDINAYHQRLVTELEHNDALRLEAALARNDALRLELDSLRIQYRELYDYASATADMLKRFINERNIYLNSVDKTVALVGSDMNAFFAVLGKEDTDPVTQSLRSGRIETAVETRLLEIFPPDKKGCFLDLGANIGSFSLFMGSKGWHGYAFEASPHNAGLLQKSVSLNEYPVTVINKAISDYTGNLYFVSCGPWGTVVSKPEPRSAEIPCVALDDLPKGVLDDAKKIDLIKMDIEGSEPAALRGMKKFLAKHDYPPIFMEVNALSLLTFRETPMSLLQLSNTLGYTAYTLGNDRTLIPRDSSAFPRETYVDVLLLKTIPEPFSYKITEPAVPDDTAVIHWLTSQLAEMETWKLDQLYLLYVLKDFPQYYNDPRIYGYLKKGPVQKKLDEFPWVSHVGEWLSALDD